MRHIDILSYYSTNYLTFLSLRATFSINRGGTERAGKIAFWFKPVSAINPFSLHSLFIWQLRLSLCLAGESVYFSLLNPPLPLHLRVLTNQSFHTTKTPFWSLWKTSRTRVRDIYHTCATSSPHVCDKFTICMREEKQKGEEIGGNWELRVESWELRNERTYTLLGCSGDKERH